MPWQLSWSCKRLASFSRTSNKTPPNQLQLFQACLSRSFSSLNACNLMPEVHSTRAVSCVSCCSTSRKKSHQKRQQPTTNNNQQPTTNDNQQQPYTIFAPKEKHKEPTKGNPRDLMLKVFDSFEQESFILGRHNDA